MIQHFYKYFREKLIPASLTNNVDTGRRANVKTYLDDTCKEAFQKQLAFQTWMAGQEELNQLADDCFDSAVSDLLKSSEGPKSGKENISTEKQFFNSCKTLYLKRLLLLWCKRWPAEANGKSLLLTRIHQLETSCRNYFIWQYIDHFTLEQMATITGKDPVLIKKQSWLCFQNMEALYRQILQLPVQEKCTEEQYYYLYGYNTNLLTSREEQYFINSVEQDKALQYYFRFFLTLTYEVIDTRLLEASIKRNSDEMKADDFISFVRNKLENRGRL